MSLAMKARQKVKRKAAAKDRVFGCDLVEHLQFSGQDVPQVLKTCTEFVEHHGIVDGIYRLSGISSNIQKLRLEFDGERSPDLNKDVYRQDIHCVSSLCKAYFRELPNPLLTYQLYDKFADAVAIQMEEGRLEKIKEVLKELPPPHYRTLEFLMKHLVHMASHSAQTNMHVRNLAIVWAPNLLRSKDIEMSGFNGTAAFMEVRIQSIVVEFILTHVEQIFGNAPLRVSSRESLRRSLLLVGSPVTYPEEKYSFSYNVPAVLNQGDGPPQMRPYHTIIELADSKRKGSIKAKKWKSIFNLGRSSNDSRRKSHKPEDKDDREGRMRLRPAKSMDSLSSLPCSSDDHTLLGRKKSQRQLTLDREGLDGPASLDSSFLESDEYSNKAKAEDAHGESEGEATAKSEPTTPKVGRSSLVGVGPQGRSPKAMHNRAEKCAGVHISGPFSVTVPFHITSNLSLSRLTRGQECPALGHFTGEKEAPETAEATDKPSSEQKEAEMRPVPAAALDTEGLAREDPAAEEEARISLEVGDTFSFLDCQDAWLGDTLNEDQPCKGPDEGPALADCGGSSLPLTDEDMGSGFMNELIGDGMQLEMFSTVQHLDYLSIEDCMNEHSEEDDDQYFLAEGFPGGGEALKEADHEEVYLSAFDDLSPLATEFQGLLQPEEAQAPQFLPPGSAVEEQPFSLAGWALPADATGSHSGEAGTQAPPSSPPGHGPGFADSHAAPEPASPSAEELGVSPNPGSTPAALQMPVKGEAEPAAGQPRLVQGEGADAAPGRELPEQAGCWGQTAGSDGASESTRQGSPSVEHGEQSSFDHELQLHAPDAPDVEQVGGPPCAPSAEADGPPQGLGGMSSPHVGLGLPFQEAAQRHRGGGALPPQAEDGPSALEGPALPGAQPSSFLGSSSENDQSGKVSPPVPPAPHPEQAASSGAAPPGAPLPDGCPDPTPMAAASPDGRPEGLPQKLQHASPAAPRDALSHDLADGGVHMRLASSSIQVQHVKSFPVVPPKPQFAKIPPALAPRAPATEAPAPWASPPPAQDCGKEPENGLDTGPLHKPLRPVSLGAPWGPASGSANNPLLAAPEPPAPSRNCCGDGRAPLKQRNSMPVSLEHYGPDREGGRDAAQSPHVAPPDGCSFWPQGGLRGGDGHLPGKLSLPERSSTVPSAGQDGRGEPPAPQLPQAALPEKCLGEACGAAPQKQRWACWRNGGSMSFDEAVALAKERHVAQAPVRRMQTYSYGDSEPPQGPPGTERPPPQPKPALRLLGQRPLRPLSCLAVAAGPASGKPEASPDTGQLPPGQEAPSTPPDLQLRSRTSLSRIGRCPSMTEEPSPRLPQERR